jgi:hypothetical protein
VIVDISTNLLLAWVSVLGITGMALMLQFIVKRMPPLPRSPFSVYERSYQDFRLNSALDRMERLLSRLEEKESSDRKKAPSSLAEIVAMLKILADDDDFPPDCGNSDCPIHGEEGIIAHGRKRSEGDFTHFFTL